MPEFFEIKYMKREDQIKIFEEIERRIKIKIRDGILTEKEIREIEQMKLHPLPDIQDIQSVYENLEFEE
jgi:hypothetical protein